MKDIVHVPFETVMIHTTVTNDPEEVTNWIKEVDNSLKHEPQNIGLDTEWTPSKNENPIAIIQLCVGSKCLIFQVNHSYGIPPSLVTFFNNPEYTFTGVEIKKDCKKLALRRAFLENNTDTFGSKMVDLRKLAVEIGLSRDKEGVGMVSLAAAVLGIALEKDENARTSKWHNEHLTQDQVNYASIDACIFILCNWQSYVEQEKTC